MRFSQHRPPTVGLAALGLGPVAVLQPLEPLAGLLALSAIGLALAQAVG